MLRRLSALSIAIVATLVAAMLAPTATAQRANRPPVLKPIAKQTVTVGRTLVVRPRASDPDHGPRALRYFTVGRPRWLSLNRRTGVMRGVAPRHAAGKAYRVRLRVTDGAASRRRTFRVRVFRNRVPRVRPIADLSLTSGQTRRVQVRATDPDNGPRRITYRVVGPRWVTINRRGVIRVAAPRVVRRTTSRVTVRAFDGVGAGRRTFRVTVVPPAVANTAPSVDDQAMSVDEGPAGSRVGTVNATDADGDDLTYALTDPTGTFRIGPSSGLITTAGPTDAEGTTRYAVTVRVSDGRADAQATVTIDVVDVNEAPSIDGVTPDRLDLVQGEPVDETVTVQGSDPDGDPLACDVSGLPAGLSAQAQADGTIHVTGTPSAAASTSATIAVSDGRGGQDTADLPIEVTAAAACAPVSVRGCSTVPVELPYALTFDGTEQGLADTGFTMVDPPSARSTVDQSPAPGAPTHTEAPGYEPGLLTVAGGNLTLRATKGIAYQKAPASSGTNSQLNTLGVGLEGDASGYEVGTEVVAPTFPGPANGSQQGGLWFGLDEDNYVKLVVSRVSATTNKVQLLKEIDGVATPGTTYELNSPAFPAGQDVRLVLEVTDTPAGASVGARYSVDSGAEVQLTDSANADSPALGLPQSFLDGTTLEAGGTPTSFTGVFATKRNADAAQEQALTFADFSVDAVEETNTAPVVQPIDDLDAIEGEPIDDVVVTASDADGDSLTMSSDPLADGLTFTDNGDGTATITGTPADGSSEESPYDVTVTADDGTATGQDTFTITVQPQAEPDVPCAPISTLPCDEIPVALPYSLTFGGDEDGLASTGFTMVDDPSNRTGVDQSPAPATPTYADVPGYEPSLLTLGGGSLTIDATKGIQYRKTPDSAGTNSQLNAVGVGMRTPEAGYEATTTVESPAFAGSANGSQQGGLWFGLDEDNYVKLVVSRVSATTNKVQLLKEVGAVATPATTYELNSAAFPSGQDVELVMRVDAQARTVEAFYAVGGGALQPLTDAANPDSPALPVPQAFLDGAALGDGAGSASFVGLFATKRNAQATDDVPVRFNDFSVTPLGTTPEPGDPVDLTVNFQSESAPVPAGTVKDFGQAYGERTGADQGSGAYTYGWVQENTEDPLSLVGNGRDRDRTSGPASTDQRLDTIMHMQYADVTDADCVANVCQDGAWQMKVPTGTYRVTVAVGDRPSYDSLHAINLENQVLLQGFQGAASAEYATRTGLVGVADGRLTVNAVGGSNTKIAYVRVETLDPLDPDSRPFIVDVRPGNRSAGAPTAEGVGTDLHLVGSTADPGPVDGSTVSTSTVKLFEVVPGGSDVPVAGTPGTTGGGDAINFQQSSALEPNTTYRYVVDGVRDAHGREFVPFASLFTTGSGDEPEEPADFTPVTGVSFEKVDLDKNGKYYSSLVVHDGYLWTTTVGQGMFRYRILADGTLGQEEAINAFAGRAAIGLVFDRTDPDVAWVTNATGNIGNEGATFGSKVTRVDFSQSVTNPTLDDVFVNLPRSKKDHLSNSIGYGPGGDLYFLQGSNSAAGDPDSAWGDRGETLLTAAMLTFDPQTAWQQVQASGAPIDVRTVDKGGSYDPFAAGAPLKIYATGIRNAYDFVHDSNGHVYVPTNGTAGGANSPGVAVNGSTFTRTGQVSEDATTACTSRRIDGQPYDGPGVPAITNHPTQRDFLFDVAEGGYYGHPNPSRCEWVLNNGGRAEGAGSGGTKYPGSVQPDENYRGWAYDFEFNKSPNGVVEYTSNTFGGKLQGRIMVVRFSNFDDVITLQSDADGKILGGQPGSTIGGLSGFKDPLDIVEDTTVNAGNMYVNSYDQSGGNPKLYLLRVPSDQAEADVQADRDRLVGNQTVGGGSAQLGTVRLTNTGDESATVSAVQVTGAGAAAYSRTVSPALPATLAPGAGLTVTVAFDPAGEGVANASLTTTVDGAAGPSVALRGLGTDGLGGASEPSLQYVLDAWQLGIDTGDDDPSTNEIHSQAASRVDPELGDGIDVEMFERAADGPVRVEPLSVFGPTTSNPVTEVSWYADGAPQTLSSVFSVGNTPASNGQTLTPAVTGPLQFDPGSGAFGLVSRWPAFSNRLVYSQDALNTFAGALPNHVRVYPLVEEGHVVPHAYVVATEETTSGLDYQDVAYVIRNVDPVSDAGPPGEPVKVNFQTDAAPVPTGYYKDFGQAYAARTGPDQGSGLSYGWINPSSGQPEGRTATGRDRNVASDQRLDTLMHMQYQQVAEPNCTVNNCNTGVWEMAVPDGSYQVTIAVGDAQAGSDPESHQISVEGTPLLASPFSPSGANGSATRHTTGTVTVDVVDGRLTLSPTGTNTKIDYADIVPYSGADMVAPQLSLAAEGEEAPGGHLAPAVVQATVTDAGSGVEFVDWKLDGATVQRPAGDRLTITEVGIHTVEVTATDGAGNAVTRSLTVSVVDGSTAGIQVTNPDIPRDLDGTPMDGLSDTYLVMHLLSSNLLDHRFWDTGHLTVTNTDSTDALVVSELSLSAPQDPTTGTRASTTHFSTPGVTVPFRVAPGASVTIPVKFSGAGSKGIYGATLTVESNAENDETLPVQLRGGWQVQPEGGQELTLTQVARIFGFSTAMGEPLQEENSTPLAGDEVRSKRWRRADPTRPVRVLQLAALHGCCGSEDQFNLSSGGSITHDGAWGQSLLPRVRQDESAPATAAATTRTFEPGSDFALRAGGYSTDTSGNLGVRTWPAKVDGQTVPNAYLMSQDYVQNGCGSGSANCDYNDNVYLVTNIEPVSPITP